MKSKIVIKILVLSFILVFFAMVNPLVNGEHVITKKFTMTQNENHETTNKNIVLAGQLTANLKVREIGGSWQENSLTVDVGTELEFQVYAKSNRMYLLVTILNELPLINDYPMFDYIEGSASPDPVAGWVDGDDTVVQWGWGSVGLFWSRTMTWRAKVVRPGTGTVEMTATGLINLDPGDYDLVQDSVQITGEGGEIPVLSFSPDSYDFGDMNEGETDSTTFEIWNSGSDTLTYTLTENCGWVSVSPTSGSSTDEQDTITVSVNTGGLSPGFKSCDIQINSNGGDDFFTVTATIIDQEQPVLSYYPDSHDFGNMLEGRTSSKTLSIWNSGSGTLNFQLNENCDWVSVSPTSGFSSGEIKEIMVTVDTSGLSIGHYYCPIQITSNGGDATFNVDVDVIADQPILSFSPEEYDFGNLLEGETRYTSFKIWNSGTDALDYSLSENCNWVDVSPTSGSSSGEQDTITVNVDTSGLSLGVHTCDILITSNGGNETFTVAVDVVEESQPVLSFSPISHRFGDMLEGETRSSSFKIWNSGDNVLTYQLSESCSWVSVSPTSGSSSGEQDTITVNVDTSGLSLGVHTCDISITSNGGSGTFTVTVNVIEEQKPIPYDPIPADGAKNVPINIILKWSCNGEGLIIYDIYLEAYDSTPGKLVAYNKLDKNYDHKGLLPDTHYYWKVVSKGENGLIEGPVWDFWTGSEEGYKISITSPETGVLQFRGKTYKSILFSMLEMSMVVGSSLHVETETVGEIEKVQFIVKKVRLQGEYWDYTSLNGFNCDMTLSQGIYKIIVNAYNGDKKVASDMISHIFFIEK